MKKILLFALTILTCTISQAQITLTEASLPQAGDRLYIGIDSTKYLYTEPYYDLATGENKDWVFNLLQFQDSEVWAYQAPEEGMASDSFPDAQMIGPFMGGEGYFSQKTDGLHLLGYNGSPIDLVDLDVAIEFVPSYNIRPVGMTYGDTVTTDFAFHEELLNANINVEVSGFAVTINSAILDVNSTVEYIADGWGTFTTPYGTWDVLRVAKREYRHTQGMAELPFLGWQDLEALDVDGFGRDTLTTFMFLSNDAKEPIVEFEMDSRSFDTSARPAIAVRFKVPATLVVDTEDSATKETPDILAFPNPAVNQVNIALTGFEPDDYEVRIYNMLGSVVARQAASFHTAMEVNMDVSQLATGTYFYTINDAFGKILLTKRMVIIRP